MKNNLGLRASARPATMMIGQVPFSSIHLVKKDPEYASNFIPVTVPVSIGPATPVLNPFFNRPFKQVGARLSEIELALDCYDIASLRFSIHDLKNLFLDMSIPAVSRLAAQMEDLAKENQFEEMKDMLREIKKIIGRIVTHRMQTDD
jgi:hypothetical protein